MQRESREARGIVSHTRRNRKNGFSVDTSGAIARAIERAYKQGFADAQDTNPPAPLKPQPDDPDAPKEWFLIPP